MSILVLDYKLQFDSEDSLAHKILSNSIGLSAEQVLGMPTAFRGVTNTSSALLALDAGEIDGVMYDISSDSDTRYGNKNPSHSKLLRDCMGRGVLFSCMRNSFRPIDDYWYNSDEVLNFSNRSQGLYKLGECYAHLCYLKSAGQVNRLLMSRNEH